MRRREGNRLTRGAVAPVAGSESVADAASDAGLSKTGREVLLDTHCWPWLQTDRERFDCDLLESLAALASQR